MEDGMSITKKIRFEIFKRDSFKCQYCGKSAPEVVLQVDHIMPRKEGGTDDIENLITACVDCNQGKGKRKLSNNDEIRKQKEELDKLNTKRQQLEMMIKWREEVTKIDDRQVDYIAQKWYECTDNQFSLNDVGKKNILRLLKKWSMNEIIDAMEKAVAQYGEREDDSIAYVPESIFKAIKMVPRICVNQKRYEEFPHLKDLYYCRGILRNRFNYLVDWQALKYLQDLYNAGVSVSEIKEVCLQAKHWTHFKETCEEYIQGVK
jgi:hypothetical protein